MKTQNTEIEGLKIIVPDVYEDERGWYSETYNRRRYAEIGITDNFVQDNESCSRKGTVRGLHWQAAPYTQSKLVRVLRGSVLDVAVDIRKDSPTFGKHVIVELSERNGKQFYIPRGFAHGFIALENNTIFSYKCDNFYEPKSERGIWFNDPSLGIQWPKSMFPLVLSEKDSKHPLLKDVTPWEESQNG